MSIIVSSYHHCNEQQFYTISCALYTFFFSNKARFSHTSTVTRLHSCSGEKNTGTPRVHIEFNILNIFNAKYITKSTIV